MGAHCGNLEPASCQVSCAVGNGGCCSSASTSSSTPVTAAPRSGSKDEEQESRAFAPVLEQEPAVKAKRTSARELEAKRTSRSPSDADGKAQKGNLNDDEIKSQASEKAEQVKQELTEFEAAIEQLKDESESDESPRSRRKSKKEKRGENLRSAIAKVKGAALGTVAELKTFRKFLKPIFVTPGEAFDDFLGFATQLDKRTFLSRLEEHSYMGNSERLFQALSGGADAIDREVFKHRLVAIGRVQAPRKKCLSFGTVVLHAVKQRKKQDLKDIAAGKEEEGWDPPPPAILELDSAEGTIPFPIEFALPEVEPASPTSPVSPTASMPSETTAAGAQPGASGQPSRRRGSSSTSSTGQESASNGSPDTGNGGGPPPMATSSPSTSAKGKAKSRGGSSRSGKSSPTTEASRRSSFRKDTGAGVRSLLSGQDESPTNQSQCLGAGMAPSLSLEYSGTLLEQCGEVVPEVGEADQATHGPTNADGQSSSPSNSLQAAVSVPVPIA